MLQSCKGFGQVLHYFSETEEIAVIIGEMFRATFPEEYVEYEAAFTAGRWVVQDPGPFMARCVVYKLDTALHYDDNDVGPTAVFVVGDFTGGRMDFPQLKCKFA